MDRKQLLKALNQYQTSFEEEKSFLPRFKSLLVNFELCYSRSLLSGHITASSFIVDHSGCKVMLLHHKKLNRWLQPGGHADGEEDLRAVAAKEAHEETGLKNLSLKVPDIFDIDIHLIPAYGNVKVHFHYDVRFLFVGDTGESFAVSDESNDVAWVARDQVLLQCNNNKSIHRMVRKTNLIFN
ncbi:MAG: NUDIX hydrolase [Cyclobacteriaceae bacterium]|nr:NUDIX hydrolase [Cyclobacteriaceae bacterium]